MTLAHVHPLMAVRVSLSEGLKRVLSPDVRAMVDSPSMDASLMDGYAVRVGRHLRRVKGTAGDAETGWNSGSG